MNTYPSTLRTLSDSEQVLSVASSARNFRVAALLLICGTLAVGAFFAFPQYDDAWMALMLREAGHHSLSVYMADRPIFGVLLEALAGFGAANKLVFAAVNIILWLALAIETGILFRRLFPELSSYSIVASCLTLAPIVVQTQLCTALVFIPANLAVILGYGAILLLLENDGSEHGAGPLQVCSAMSLAIAGVAVSEYGVATNLAGCAILFALGLVSMEKATRQKLMTRAGGLLVLTGCAYAVFVKTANLSVRPDVAPTNALHRGLTKYLEIPFDVISGTWHSVIGGYALAFGTAKLAWDSKSTMLGFLFGLLLAGLLCLSLQNSRSDPWEGKSRHHFAGRLGVLLFAIAAGLLPFSVMGRATTLLDFGSRFRIPVLPLAAVGTVSLALNMIRPYFRWIAVAALGFIAGYATWISTYTAVERTRAISTLEGVLKPYVGQSNGITVAVVPFERFETELTADVTSTWPVEQEKKIWVIPSDGALQLFGSRGRCSIPNELNVRVRGLSRVGTLDRVLWVSTPEGRSPEVEPYCF